MSHDHESGIDLKVHANAVRAKLLRVVEELDRRGHEAVDLRLQMRKHAGELVIAGIAVMAATIGAIALAAHRATVAAERRRIARGGILRGRWRAPAPPPPARPGFLAETARSIAVAAITAFAMIPIRRFAGQIAGRPKALPRAH